MSQTARHYHEKTLQMLSPRPVYSLTNAAILEERKRICRVGFPEALRQWYSLENATALLRQHSNDDHPVPLQELGEPVVDWYGVKHRDFLSNSLLWIMGENQGVCNWAVDLNGSDDPPVLVEVDSAPKDNWVLHAGTFSEFIYCRVWDSPLWGFSCSPQEPVLREYDLKLLRSRFLAEPTTYGWPGDAQVRFTAPQGRILLWITQSCGVDWKVSARTADQLESLVQAVWDIGTLASTLYGPGAPGESVLSKLRR